MEHNTDHQKTIQWTELSDALTILIVSLLRLLLPSKTNIVMFRQQFDLNIRRDDQGIRMSR